MNRIKMNLKDFPLYFRNAAKNGKQFILFGEIKETNNPYAMIQDRKCQNSLCKVLVENLEAVNKMLVVKQDGTVWTVYKSNFKEYHYIDIIK